MANKLKDTILNAFEASQNELTKIQLAHEVFFLFNIYRLLKQNIQLLKLKLYMF